MDTILGILGLALAIASLVPAFTATKTKLKIVAVAITLALIGVIGVQVYRAHTERTAIESAKEDVLRLLVGDNPLSFDQIYGSLNYVDYETVAEAIDELVSERQIHHRPVEATSESGKKYVVRVYNSIDFPIP